MASKFLMPGQMITGTNALNESKMAINDREASF